MAAEGPLEARLESRKVIHSARMFDVRHRLPGTDGLGIAAGRPSGGESLSVVTSAHIRYKVRRPPSVTASAIPRAWLEADDAQLRSDRICLVVQLHCRRARP